MFRQLRMSDRDLTETAAGFGLTVLHYQQSDFLKF